MINFYKRIILKIKRKVYLIFKTKSVKGFYDIKLVPNFSDRTFNSMFMGAYGDFYSNYLSKISASFNFVDFGSNQGLYSMLSSKNEFCNKCFSFEPNPSIYQYLKRNLILNNITNVKTFNKGIGKENEKLLMYQIDNHSGSSSFIKHSDQYNKENYTEIINYEKLSKIIPQNYPIHIKIDVEGYEKIVLDEIIRSDFISKVKSIFIEIDTRWTHEKTITNKLNKLGFYKLNHKKQTKSHYDLLFER